MEMVDPHYNIYGYYACWVHVLYRYKNWALPRRSVDVNMQAVIHGVSWSGKSIPDMTFDTIDANVDFKIYRRYIWKSQLCI